MAVALIGVFASALPAAAASGTQSKCVWVKGVCHVPLLDGSGTVITPPHH
jgi:hypothetical protein